MKKLVVVADDFGWTDSVNAGILRAHKEGIVTELSLMLSCQATGPALEIIKKEKIPQVGIHLSLNPANKFGKVLHRADYQRLFKELSSEEISQLVTDELKEFEQVVGSKPTHICPQYGIHGNLKVLNSLLLYAKTNQIPIRLPRTVIAGEGTGDNYAARIMMRRMGVVTTDYLFGHVLGADLTGIKENFLSDFRTLKDGQSAEMLTHPGYFDAELLKMSSLNYERVRDLALLLDPDFRSQIKDLDIDLVNYSQI